VHDAATLEGSEIKNYAGINILTIEPLAIIIFGGVVPVIVKFVFDYPVSYYYSVTKIEI